MQVFLYPFLIQIVFILLFWFIVLFLDKVLMIKLLGNLSEITI